MTINYGDIFEIENEEYTCVKVVHDVDKIYYGMFKFSEPVRTLFVTLEEGGQTVTIIQNDEEKLHILELMNRNKNKKNW